MRRKVRRVKGNIRVSGISMTCRFKNLGEEVQVKLETG